MFKSYGNKKQNHAVKQQSSKKFVGALYYHVGINGTETIFLHWFRSWKDYKITEFAAEYREILHDIKWKEYNMEAEWASLQNKPLLPISKDYWIPTTTKIAMLVAEEDEVWRGYLECFILSQRARMHSAVNV